MLRQLRIKFICVNMTIVTIMLGSILGTVLTSTYRNLARQSTLMLQEAAEWYTGNEDAAMHGGAIRLPCFILHLDAEGDVLNWLGDAYVLGDPECLLNIIETATEAEGSGVIREYALRYYSVLLEDGEVLAVYADVSSEWYTMKELLYICAFAGVFGLGVFLLISVLLARWAIKPVEQAWIQQRQFVADASHELKTPLTVITTNAELLLDPDSTPEQRQRCASYILTMARQMRGLINGLLELARLDQNEQTAPETPLDFSELIGETVLPFEAVFFERDLMLDSIIDPGIMVRGNAAQLGQVAEILLDNAQKYSVPDTKVVLALRRLGRGACVLSVTNVGPPISKEDLTNIFKRFYRADSARSMNQSYGLGLSIAESIVRRHRGRIWAESEDGVSVFRVQLPALS